MTARLWPALMSVLLLLSGGAGGQERIANATIERRSGARGLQAELLEAGSRGTPVWVGYQVPAAPGRREMCDHGDRRAVVMLEPPTHITVLVRLDAASVVRLRTVTPDCEIDAGGMPVVWLDAVGPDDSVAWLEKLATGPPGPRADKGVPDAAIAAISFHKAASADRTLIAMARDNPSARLKGRALFWIAQRAGDQAVRAIGDAIDRDPDTEVKKKAVFALTQLPRDEGVPTLIEVARANANAAVRKQAMFWLGQSNDPRALKFFEEILLR